MAPQNMSDDDILAKIEETTAEAMRHQLQTLQMILNRNSTVQYLRPFLSGDDRRHKPPEDAAEELDIKGFLRRVPVSTYDDYHDLINRMADSSEKGEEFDGEDDRRRVLSVDPLVCFFLSSGTSSMKPKLVPYYDSAPSKAASIFAHQGSGAILRRLFPPRPSVYKNLWFLYAGNITTTKGGLKAMAASSFPLHNNKARQSQYLASCITPVEVTMGSDLQQQIYCHLLCGLKKPDLIDGVQAPYAIGLIRAFTLLESKWEQMCEDLEKGVPNSEITDEKMRNSVSKFLGVPCPDLAFRIRSICEKKDWNGIIAKLWPNTRYIRCVSTGSMSQYYRKLKDYAGQIPLLGGDYFASECCIGINLDILQPPELTRYVMLPTAAYFEFIPFDMETNSTNVEEMVDFSGVEVGKLYEVVVTTHRGFYRYRLGDVVRVVGFHNASPEVELVMRAPKSTLETLTERDLARAAENLQFALGSERMGEIVEFSCFIDSELKQKQLEIFIEVREGCMLLQKEKSNEAIAALMSCRDALEESLGYLYRAKREKGEFGPLLLWIMGPGTYDRLIQMAVENDTPASQYKPPKIIRNPKIADFMKGNAVLTVCLNSSNC